MVRSESIPVARRFPSVFLRYGLAVALVAAALGLTLLLQKVVTTTGYFFFYVAVGASTWFCGKWCGWLAVILSTLVIDYVFVPPFLTWATNRNTVLVFIEFAAFFSAIGWFSSWRKRVETALQHGRDELQMRV